MDYQMKHPVSIWTQVWRVWRHCCCRHGFLPLLVAPILSGGMLLSCYSSLGCEFVKVDIGFTPSNFVWNETTIDVGIFYYTGGSLDVNHYSRPFAKGCSSYGRAFEKQVVSGDRLWKATRILSTISGICSIVAVLISWLLVLTPLPVSFIWPGCLLPLVVTAFLAEGTKFIFVDASVCTRQVWYPSGADSLPETAKSCHMGKTGYYAVGAVTVFLVGFLIICFTSPSTRELDDNYGTSYQLEEGSDQESAQDNSYPGDELLLFPSVGHQGYVLNVNSSNRSYAKSRDESSYDNQSLAERTYESNPVSRKAVTREQRVSKSVGSFDCMAPSTSNSPISNQCNNLGSSSSEENGRDDREQPSNGRKQCSQEKREEASYSQGQNEPIKPIPPSITKIPSPSVRISDSRLSRAEKLQLATHTDSDEMIDKFVMDLDKSFQTDS